MVLRYGDLATEEDLFASNHGSVLCSSQSGTSLDDLEG